MANEKNLKSMKQSSEEAKKNGQKGGLASGAARRKKRDIKKTLEMLLDDKVTDISGTEYSRAEEMAITLLSIACDREHKQCIQAQRLIYELTEQDKTAEDKKRVKLQLKQMEKDIELTQKRIDNADW